MPAAPIPMCGVPVHAAEAYLARLIRRGFRVAVAEQMEDAKARRSAKVPIARAVVRLITPGTLTEDALLEAGRTNYLLALTQVRGGAGRGLAGYVHRAVRDRRALAPAPNCRRCSGGSIRRKSWRRPGWTWATGRPGAGQNRAHRRPGVARRNLAEAFAAASLDAFGHFSDAEAVAAALAVAYVRTTQDGKMPRLSHPTPRGSDGTMAMDAATRASLEILRARDGGVAHTLLGAVQRTLSAAGARLLAEQLAAPLTDPAAIAERQDGWSWLLANPDAARDLRLALRAAPDMARALGRISLQRGGPRDLAAICDGLAAAGAARAILAGPVPAVLADCAMTLEVDPALAELLGAALADPAPVRLDDGGVIRTGYDGELDAERTLRDDTRGVLARLQLDYAQRYGVASLKIRHHAQLGYVIEASAIAVEKLQAHPDLTLRQGMANGARFSNPELVELNRRIVEAADRAAARERAVFAHLLRTTMGHADALAGCAAALARLDVAQSAARLAEAGTWCRPVVGDDDAFAITAGRHPVVEAALSGSTAFVPNDCDLSPDRRLLLLTGPNMAGKSTFIRQNALAVVLAQAGQPVPAEAALHWRGGPIVLARGRRGRLGARAVHLHGGNDGDGGDPAPGWTEIAGGGR